MIENPPIHFHFSGEWKPKIQLDALRSFRNASGSYTSFQAKENQGWVQFYIQDDLSLDPDPLPSQLNSINFIIENQEIFFSKMLEYVYEDYPRIQKIYGSDIESKREFAPDIHSPDELKQMIGVGNIFISRSSTNGFSHIGLECGCQWDDEHGLGVSMDRYKLLALGDASEGIIGGTGQYIPPDRPIRYVAHPKYGKLKPSHKAANLDYPFKLLSKKLDEEFINEYEAGDIDSAAVWSPTRASLLEYAIQRKSFMVADYLAARRHSFEGILIRSYKFKPFDKEILDYILANGADINEMPYGYNLVYQLTSDLASHFRYKERQKKYPNSIDYDLKIKETKELISYVISRGGDPYLGENQYKTAFRAGGTMDIDIRKEIDNFLKLCAEK